MYDERQCFVAVLHTVLGQGLCSPTVDTGHAGMFAVDEQVRVFRLRHIRSVALLFLHPLVERICIIVQGTHAQIIPSRVSHLDTMTRTVCLPPPTDIALQPRLLRTHVGALKELYLRVMKI